MDVSLVSSRVYTAIPEYYTQSKNHLGMAAFCVFRQFSSMSHIDYYLRTLRRRQNCC
jgi:hypothetical protein